MAKKRRRKRTAYQKACERIETEGRRQCFLLYSAAALALHRHWGKKKVTIIRLFEITGEVWHDCAEDNTRSMIEMCEKETGIEIRNESGKSWEDLPYMNATLDTSRMSYAQWIYMRQQQVKWIPAQVMACIMVALHRKYGFGYDRCARFYEQVREIEAQYGMDPERIRMACIKETGIDVTDAFLQGKEGKKVV